MYVHLNEDLDPGEQQRRHARTSDHQHHDDFPDVEVLLHEEQNNGDKEIEQATQHERLFEESSLLQQGSREKGGAYHEDNREVVDHVLVGFIERVGWEELALEEVRAEISSEIERNA